LKKVTVWTTLNISWAWRSTLPLVKIKNCHYWQQINGLSVINSQKYVTTNIFESCQRERVWPLEGFHQEKTGKLL